MGLDPVEFRLRNLSNARFRRVLERAADAHDWAAGAQPTKRGAGVAIGIDVGSYCATCVQLDVQGSEVRRRAGDGGARLRADGEPGRRAATRSKARS